MIIGFKTGPRNWEAAQKIVTKDGARMCEVWFNVLKEAEYAEMFTWLRKHNVQIGLHHWGLARGKLKTNLMTQDQEVREETLRQMRRAIEIGTEIGAGYVNVHPGARCLEEIDFATQTQALVKGSETSETEAEKLLMEGAAELAQYAQARGVLFLMETLPACEAVNFAARVGSYDPGNPPLSLMIKLAKQKVWLANDLTHTAAQIAIEDSSREGMWRRLHRFTEEAAPHTRLLHVNTVREPFDGRDSHDGLLPEDFSQGFFPSRAQLLELLKIFADRDDVYAVAEPQLEVTRENFLALREIAEEAASR
jgi:hypothetical protein